MLEIVCFIYLPTKGTQGKALRCLPYRTVADFVCLLQIGHVVPDPAIRFPAAWKKQSRNLDGCNMVLVAHQE